MRTNYAGDLVPENPADTGRADYRAQEARKRETRKQAEQPTGYRMEQRPTGSAAVTADFLEDVERATAKAEEAKARGTHWWGKKK
jgi:hypothetical protein